MSSQQLRFVEFAEFVEAVKRKRARPPNPHDFEDSAPIRTNYGNKLKRHAQYVQEGQLDVPRGAGMYTQEIEHSGYRRKIIFRNPLLFDEDGDVVEDHSDLEEGDAAPIEENPYEGIKIEELLKPLTSAAELPTHPSMTLVYADPGLPEMIRNAEQTLHKEQRLLWMLKELFTKFRGDVEWVPVGDMHTDYDDLLLAAAINGTTIGEKAHKDEESSVPALGWEGEADSTEGASHAKIVANGVKDGSTTELDMADAPHSGENDPETLDLSGPRSPNGINLNGAAEPRTNGNTIETGTNGNPAGTTPPPNNDEEGEDSEMADPSPEQRRMTTRALALVPQAPSRSPSPPQIHPFFLPPHISSNPEPANPDEDPLPPLLSYISKQEEIVRLSTELYQGLLKALRMRKDVFKWCKAEGHVGEMSDGEDWVDLDEWGLDEGQLVKGKEEDDNENNHAGEGGPSRRGRRGGRGGGGAGASG